MGYLGENPLNKPTNLFPIILDVAMSKNKELSIFGNDWPTKDGTCKIANILYKSQIMCSTTIWKNSKIHHFNTIKGFNEKIFLK